MNATNNHLNETHFNEKLFKMKPNLFRANIQESQARGEKRKRGRESVETKKNRIKNLRTNQPTNQPTNHQRCERTRTRLMYYRKQKSIVFIAISGNMTPPHERELG
uniref:Uncharacterized protein n=1 Tax=Glossina pallidipes TaxID=7398 RepID=A0A1A9ZCQ0_GLOPL